MTWPPAAGFSQHTASHPHLAPPPVHRTLEDEPTCGMKALHDGAPPWWPPLSWALKPSLGPLTRTSGPGGPGNQCPGLPPAVLASSHTEVRGQCLVLTPSGTPISVSSSVRGMENAALLLQRAKFLRAGVANSFSPGSPSAWQLPSKGRV